MAKKAPKDPSKMSIAELGQFLDGADKMLSNLRHDLAVAESDVKIFRHEMAKRLGLSAGSAAATRSTGKGGGKKKAATAEGDFSDAQVQAIKEDVLAAIPASGKGMTAGDVRKKLEREPRLVELAFKALNADGKLKPADPNAKGRFRAMLKVG